MTLVTETGFLCGGMTYAAVRDGKNFVVWTDWFMPLTHEQVKRIVADAEWSDISALVEPCDPPMITVREYTDTWRKADDAPESWPFEVRGYIERQVAY